MRNAIFLTFDYQHAHKAFHCLNSIKANYPYHPEIIIYYNGNEPEILNRLKKYSGINLFLNQVLPNDIIIPDHHKGVSSKMVYYKYLLWTDRFSEYDNILHLDADTIIRAPLNNLIEKDYFFIVRNNLYFNEIKILTELNDGLATTLNWWRLDYPNQKDMVNAGVFVIPKYYRTPQQYHLLLKLTESFRHYLKYGDQSVLSLWCIINKIAISDQYQYNFQMPLFNKFFMPRYKGYLDIGWFLSKKKSILNKIDIIHFSGDIKPDNRRDFLRWDLMGRYAKMFSDCYYKYGKNI